MWTLVYVDYEDNTEHYERFDTKIQLKCFIDRHELADSEDILIFPPDSEVEASELY